MTVEQLLLTAVGSLATAVLYLWRMQVHEAKECHKDLAEIRGRHDNLVMFILKRDVPVRCPNCSTVVSAGLKQSMESKPE